MLCEFGIAVPLGAETGQAIMRAQLANELLDQNLRRLLAQVLEEIEGFKQQIVALDRRLQALSDDDPVLVKLESLPGIGWITATALRASVGDIHRFKNGRTLSNWMGVTPKEHSSGSNCNMGRMNKRGEVYLRTWAIKLRERSGFNKAAVGLANKMTRIVWALGRIAAHSTATRKPRRLRLHEEKAKASAVKEQTKKPNEQSLRSGQELD